MIVLRSFLPADIVGKYAARVPSSLLNSEDWGKVFTANHLEPGVVRYQADDGSERTYLLPAETIAKMRPTAEGKPIVGKSGGFDHKQVSAGQHEDGAVVESFPGSNGWEQIRFLVWDPETKRACQMAKNSGDNYQISCAYIPTQTDGKPGLWHNVPYDETILDGEYTHFAIVPNPRYEGAVIFANSLKEGGKDMVMELLFGGKKVALDKAAPVSIDGKEVSIGELVNSFLAAEAVKAKPMTPEELANALKDDATELEVAGKKVTVGELKAKHAAALKNAADEAEAKKKADEEAKNAADAAAKKAADEKANASGDADDFKIKQNAGGGFDIFDKEGKHQVEANSFDSASALCGQMRAAKNAADAEAKKKAEAAKTAHFNALREAARQRGGNQGDIAQLGVVTTQDKEDLGRSRYGSPVEAK